jgi:hypothetical protein
MEDDDAPGELDINAHDDVIPPPAQVPGVNDEFFPREVLASTELPSLAPTLPSFFAPPTSK